jgi:hypothetical protein
LVRTNPKLTGNIKLAIDESDNLWLESIKANPELSKDDYSKFAVDPNISHPANIFRFLKNGETPNEIVFDIKEQVSSTKTSKDFKNQFDFSHYFSGVKYLASNKYQERLSYLAPLYIKGEVPNFFIILKIEDPADFVLSQIRENYENGQTKGEYISNLFKKSSIIKTFDLRPETKAGKYLRDYVQNVNFPQSPLTVGFEENDYTTWNGILANEGAFGSRGELLYEFYQGSSPLKFFEENITNGFSRNGIIFPNILNLEFVFNDTTSEKYDFNRYLGFYVNAIELSQLDIDLDRAYDSRPTWENTPLVRKRYLETDEVIVDQNNPDGVVIPYKNLDLKISEFTDLFTDADSLYLTYLTDKDSNIYSPKIDDPYAPDYSPTRTVELSSTGTSVLAYLEGHGYSTDDLITITSPDSGYSGEFLITLVDANNFTYTSLTLPSVATSTGTARKELTTGEFRFSNKNIDLGLFFGQSRNIFLQDRGAATKVQGYSHIALTINSELNDYDEFRLYHPGGTRIDANGKYDLFTAALNYIEVPNAGDYYAFNDYDGVVGYDVFYFNAGGYTNEIASALVNCINSTRNRTFTAYAYDNRIFIKVNSPGEFDSLYKLGFTSIDYSTLAINKLTGASLASQLFAFAGGSKEVGNRLIIDAGHLQKILDNFDSILVKSSDSWSKIRKVSQYIDEINDINSVTKALRSSAIESYDEKIAIVLDENETPTIAYKDFIMRPKFRPSFGLLSFFQIKDLDFDFYSSSYTNFPEVDLYNHYYVLPDTFDLVDQYEGVPVEYKIAGKGEIKINLNETTSTSPIDLGAISSGLTIGVSPGIFVEPGLTFDPTLNQTLKFKYSDDTYFTGLITSYNSSTGQVSMVVITVAGTGTYSDWEVYLAVSNSFVDPLPPFPPSLFSSPFMVSEPCSYSIVSGNPFVTYSDDSLNTGASLIIPINDANNELKDFPGFSILKDPSKVVPAGTSDEFLLRTKFLNGITPTEYDYYKENDSVDFALRSKIIPYITKWGIKNGKDSRDNPYRLNTELVFSRNNFSPDHEDRTQNPVNFTHEWFYIESKFNYLNSEITAKLNSTYFENPIDLNLLLSDPNYFINYFTYTPSYTDTLVKEVADTQFRYSNLFKNRAGQYEAFFKGFKMVFKDVTDPTVLGLDGKPVAKDSTNRFDGYKFSCILKPIQEDINDSTQPPVKYKVIEHKDHKFIVIVIELTIGSIESIDDYWWSVPLPGGITTVTNIVPISPPSGVYPVSYIDPTYTTEFGSTLPFDTINGDYRISFDSNGVSNLTHTLLYALKNKKYNTTLNNFSTTKMASKLALSQGIPLGGTTIGKLENISISNYPAILTDDVVKPSDSTIIAIKNIGTNIDLFIDKVAGVVAQNVNPVVSSIEQFLNYELGAGLSLALTTTSSTFPYSTFYSLLPGGSDSIVQNYYSFKVINGGEGYFEKLLEKISFARFKKYVNDLAPFIEYYSYSLDSNGVSVLAANPNFYLEILDQSRIGKVQQVIPIQTTDIPVQYSGEELVGYDYEVAKLSQQVTVNRYKGEYEPIVRNQLIFNSNFEFNKNQINDLKLSNTKINGMIDSIMTLPNFNHIKIANNLILDLESDDTYLAVYPRINEVAIGQADYFLFRNNWDWGFHLKYSSKSEYQPVSGALRVEEDESFIAKTVTLPETIELENFNVTLIGKNDNLDDVDLTQIEIVAKESPLKLEGYINVNNVLTRHLLEDGISQKFNEFLVMSSEYIGNFNSIEEYVREYIRLNILKLYEISLNEFYSKSDASLTSASQETGTNVNSIEFVSLNDQQRNVQGFNIIKTLQINKQDRLILKFSFTKKLGAGLLISPKIKINFI